MPSVAFIVRTNSLNIGNSRSSGKVELAEKWKRRTASASKEHPRTSHYIDSGAPDETEANFPLLPVGYLQG